MAFPTCQDAVLTLEAAMSVKRSHSPDYPAVSLRDAVDRIRKLHTKIQGHTAPREIVAQGIGYASLNGASMSAIAALRKYGLLEKVGDGLKISERALQILFPASLKEKDEGVRAAALTPPLFAELHAQFGGVPDIDLLRNYLVRKGFLSSAVAPAINAFRETMELVTADSGLYNRPHEMEITPSGELTAVKAPNLTPELPPPISNATHPTFESMVSIAPQLNERKLFQYDLENGVGGIGIVTRGQIDTAEALAIVADWIKMKQKELKRKAKLPTASEEVPS